MELKIALGTIFLIVLIVGPGTFVRRGYFSTNFTKEHYQGKFYDRLILTILSGILAQCLTIFLFNKFSTLSLKLEEEFRFGEIKLSESWATLIDPTDLNFESYSFYGTLFYFFLLAITSFFLGNFSNKVVRILRLDIFFPILRYSNYWHYYLTGDIFKSSRFRRRLGESSKNLKGSVSATYLDVLCRHSDKTELYTGKFLEYTINHDTNELENLMLTETLRWKEPKENKSNSNRPNASRAPLQIPGQILSIPASTIININFRYVLNEIKPFRERALVKAITRFLMILLTLSVVVLPPLLSKSKWYSIILGTCLLFIAYLFVLGIITAKKPVERRNKSYITGYIITSIIVVGVPLILALWLLI